jgi:hypothetical protein
LADTIEDASLADPGERVRRFGQKDHLRLYARLDFVDRLKQGGFDVSELGLQHFGVETFIKYGISQSSVLYICRKNTAAKPACIISRV